MPVGKGYKAHMSKSTKGKGKGGHSAKSASLPSGRASGKATFKAKAYAKMRTKVFGLANKEQMGKA